MIGIYINLSNQLKAFSFPIVDGFIDFDFAFNFYNYCKISYFLLAKVACSYSLPL